MSWPRAQPAFLPRRSGFLLRLRHEVSPARRLRVVGVVFSSGPGHTTSERPEGEPLQGGGVARHVAVVFRRQHAPAGDGTPAVGSGVHAADGGVSRRSAATSRNAMRRIRALKGRMNVQ